MLKSLALQNFRGFSDHRVEFGPESILIGQNNAGKTTIIEALRLLSVAQNKANNAAFAPCPAWLYGNCKGAGFRFSLETIDFDFMNVQHGYDKDSPSFIKAKLSNNNEIHLWLGAEPDQTFCQLRIGQNIVVHSKSDVTPRRFGSTKVMPPIGSLLAHEKRIAKERLLKFFDGYLAHRHFRNQLWERPAEYRIFRELMESTWSGLKIDSFEDGHGDGRNEFSLIVREGRFASEVSWHGHGLQAWMQTVWFLARAPKDVTIVLDEPDVYLHADLQRKLIKVIEGLKFKQTVVATHSPEIISDVPFQNIVVVQKRSRISKSAENAPIIQRALRDMGSLHSIQLSKLAQKGFVLWVEGDDRRFLSEVAYKMGVRFFDKFSQMAIHELNGKDNWQRALGTSQALTQLSNGEIGAALLIDRDYMLNTQIDDWRRRAEKVGLNFHIWDRKEIENYFISKDAILRILSSKAVDGVEVSVTHFERFFSEIAADLKEDATLSFADVIQKASSPRIEAKSSVKKARELIAEKLEMGIDVLEIVSGKEFLSKLSDRCKKEFGVSFSALAICKEMRPSEYPREITSYIAGICGLKF